ncbi:M24 family metallopeptidase [Mucilaginibacter sp. dw_454]|uniref:M24 family metallopeptidase n=1 Tax=Mucilaginibacter sp. dw_454 TaxID=2720079 RepID=UPI001BD1BEE7|nr:M24 family metallopeptidase [Mucilaginibacter sp. dw_454]
MNNTRQNLTDAENKAKELFKTIEGLQLIVPGKTEKQLNDEVVKVASEVFDIEEFWHKKIVRAGINTMQPYGGNPPDAVIQHNDMVILDFGPIVNGWEADLGRSYVLGDNPAMLKLKEDVEDAWQLANAWYSKQTRLTGSEFYSYINNMAAQYGYTFGGGIAGHIVGPYPHEQLGPDDLGLDIHPDNHQDMFAKDPQGNDRHWILEIHFNDEANNIGAFFEQLLY